MNIQDKQYQCPYLFALKKYQEHKLFHLKKLILLLFLSLIFLTNNLLKAFEVSDLMIQFFKKVHPPIKTSSLAGINVFQLGFSKVSDISILKSSAFSFV